MNGHQSAGIPESARRPGEVLGCASLSHRIEDQQRLETNKHCTASSTSKPSPASVTVRWVLFLLPLNITGLGSAHATVSVDITLPIGPSPLKQQGPLEKFFGAFLFMESEQMELSNAWKANQ